MVSLIKEMLGSTLAGYRAKKFHPFPARFIVSTGRTGTQFFESFFNNHFPEVLCLHEPAPDGFDLGINKIREDLQKEQIVLWLHRNRSQVASRLVQRGAAIYVESNPFFSLLIPELRTAFPDCRFLWIVRDPKTYVVSAYNKSPVGDRVMFFYATNDHRNRMTALDFLNDRWRNEWPQFDRFQRICWYWNKCNAILEKELANQGDALLIKFEQLFDPEGNWRGMTRVLEFFGIHLRDRLTPAALDAQMRTAKNSAERVLLQGAETWSAEQKHKFEELTSPMRRRLGYQ
jgi:hypothetical protein